MTIAVTGAHGFLGWHLSCRLLATYGVPPVRLGRSHFADVGALARALADVDTVVHVAGVNRAESDEAVEHGNVVIAERLAAALGGRPVHLVYANSVHADGASPYGRGKRRAAEILAGMTGTFADVVLPNLFGEHGRPGYNSFVATFAAAVAQGQRPTVTDDRRVPLLHAQDAAAVLLEAAEKAEDGVRRPAGEQHGIGEVLGLLDEFHAVYAGTGGIPDISTPFRRDLFNTYRAALFPKGFPVHPQIHADPRGELIETVRAHGGTGQGYVSATRPGSVRGEHYHLRKFERFAVFRGEAEVQLRRLFTDRVVTFRVSGTRPGLLDMPTMWVHNLRNVGDEDLVTAFWSDQLLDPDHPDQYPMKVVEEG